MLQPSPQIASSVQAVRDLVTVPPRTEAALQLYMSQHPEDVRGIEKVLGFRKCVLEECDRLVCGFTFTTEKK
jgi:hypothetical protein